LETNSSKMSIFTEKTMATEMIVVVFPTRRALTRALDHLQETKVVDIKRAAVIAKAGTGETVILDDDLSPDEGGITGGTLGAAMALLGIVQLGALALPGVGPIIALGGSALVGGLLGNVTGRFAANLLDFGYKNEQIEALSERLQEGHPALVMEIKEPQQALETLRTELKPFRAELIEPLNQAANKLPPADVN
jgi:uncharacterized membrane protein